MHAAIIALVALCAVLLAACETSQPSSNPRDYAVNIRDVPQIHIRQSYKAPPVRRSVWNKEFNPEAGKAPPMAGGIMIRVHND